MKKIILRLFTLFVVAVMMSACGQTEKAKSDKISVVCTIFPQYDWVRQILGDRSADTDLTLLLNSGIDLHSYQPSVEDMVKISSCDMLVYVGGESDDWVNEALKTATNKDMVVVNLMDTLGDTVKNEEIKEGMEHEQEHEHEHGDLSSDELDEHVWLSLKNASSLCTHIAEKLCTIDPNNEKVYRENAKAYNEKLMALDSKYKETVSDAVQKSLLFGDRFPFRYLVDDYGLDYFAAFPGCSAETEASFDTVIFLANKANELGLNTIMVTESSDKSIAKTIIDNTASKNQQVLVMNSMQSITTADIEKGTTYLSVMESNLDTLKDALK